MRSKINSQKAEVSEKYIKLIKSLQEDKVKINEEKISRFGSIDIDDHGYIDFPDFRFTPECCEDGLVHGCALIGRNFRRFLNEMPKYINKNSALAGCWIGNLQRYIPFGVAKEDRPSELDEIIEKYRIRQSGFAGMNHLCPDLEIGMTLGWKGLLEKVRTTPALNQTV